jgi:indolepyruvate ferredoxin oxidoreductase
VINNTVQPTSDFIRDGDLDFDNPALRDKLAILMGDNADFVNATELALAATGDSVATNAFMLGYAWQKGLIPLKHDSIERAIELNAVSVDSNKRIFRLGQLAAQGEHGVRSSAASLTSGGGGGPEGVEAIVARRKADLESYQNAALASVFENVVNRAIQAESRLGQPRGLAEAAAKNLYKLMAYKDEYEVARLYSDGEFLRRLHSQFESGFKLQFHLAPPLIARRNPATGELIKGTYGSWLLPVFKVLAKARFLRGTWADPFGYTTERKTERKLIHDYIKLVDEIGEQITEANWAQAVEIINWPQAVRGYGHVKERSLTQARHELEHLLRAFSSGAAGVEPNPGTVQPRAADILKPDQVK